MFLISRPTPGSASVGSPLLCALFPTNLFPDLFLLFLKAYAGVDCTLLLGEVPPQTAAEVVWFVSFFGLRIGLGGEVH